MGNDYIPAETPEEMRVLVGWTADDIGERVLLKMQGVAVTADNTDGDDGKPVFTQPYFMTRQQAVLLGNFLYRVSGATPPPQKRSWISRLLGG